jgi:hypothetical protein
MWKSESQTQFRPSLTEVSHVAWREAPLEMAGGTKGGAQRARIFQAYVRRGGSPVTATPIYHLPSAVCVAPPEDGHVMLETRNGSWFSINWIKSASRWFHYTDLCNELQKQVKPVRTLRNETTNQNTIDTLNVMKWIPGRRFPPWCGWGLRLFRYVTRRKLVVGYRRFGTAYRLHLHPWPFQLEPMGCPETSASKYRPMSPNISEEQDDVKRHNWTDTRWGIGVGRCVNNY